MGWCWGRGDGGGEGGRVFKERARHRNWLHFLGGRGGGWKGVPVGETDNGVFGPGRKMGTCWLAVKIWGRVVLERGREKETQNGKAQRKELGRG